MATIEERLKALEDAAALDSENAVIEMRRLAEVRAQIDTLVQLATEIESLRSDDATRFLSRFRRAFQWHLSRYLGIAGDIDPSLAARIDDRSPDEVSTDELPPRILDQE